MDPTADDDGRAPRAVMSPSRNDPLVHTLSEVVGGPVGSHAAPGIVRRGIWTPELMLLILTAAAAVAGVLIKGYCRANGWNSPAEFYATCYSDFPTLFKERGFADGILPLFTPGTRFEYPVVTSFIAAVTALVVPGHGASDARATAYFDVNATLAALMWMIAVVATARLNLRRPWDAALLAIAPGAILAGFINWDLWAVAFLSLGILAFSRNRPVLAGLAIGLGTATKFYPVLVLGVLVLLAIRTGRWRQTLLVVGSAALAWLLVDLPAMIGDPRGWAFFYEFSASREPGFSSAYYAWNLVADRLHWTQISAPAANALFIAGFGVCCLGIAFIALHAPRRPRLAQLAFLVVAAFTLTGKVYSPQYVVWLIPLLALARPRWRDFLVWMAAEALHWTAVWMYLGFTTSNGPVQNNIDSPYYAMAVLVHMAILVYLCIHVVADIYDPSTDPIRRSRQDDPQGGEFDGAPDAVTIARSGLAFTTSTAA
ncbi:glycosyltransferase 87 family protein [Sinomonas sp. ASV322]|uniref:glycosyltransferase family 87 protein n=1 Tax=Sinomonas sp. ASV322 TaxID=3041920 RepID=UPI0027DC5EB4|nr:glycosyltransferase 87 family protein [Sinomonas sp. ASV322]MDQ4503935.1 glycosyltransferase 87 family protein [Sinomonas sp. ASV322]